MTSARRRGVWRLVWSDRTFAALLAAATMLSTYAAVNGALWERRQRALVVLQVKSEADIATLRRELWERDGATAAEVVKPAAPARAKIAGYLAIGGYTAVLPVRSLAALSIGQSDVEPTYTAVSLWKQRQDLFADSELLHPYHVWSGHFDPAFLIIYLWPLLLIAATYDVISREEEDGTLPLIRSAPVRAGRILMERTMARAALLLVPIVVLPILGCWAASDGHFWGLEVLPGLLGWTAVVCVYTAFWILLAVAINAVGSGSAANALALVCAWLALAIVGPQLLNLVLARAVPVPTRIEYVRALRSAQAHSESAATSLLLRYYTEHPETRPAGRARAFVAPYFLQQWSVGAEMEPVLSAFEAAHAGQIRWASRLQFASPTLLILDVVNQLAGTGSRRLTQFRRSVTEFHGRWHAFFAPRAFLNVPMTVSVYDEVPRFHFVDGSATADLRAVGASLCGLVVFSGLVGAVAYRGLRWRRLV
jgi:ABC-2 type transport system permease protein